MENQKLSPGKFSVNYGLGLGIILIVISAFMYVTDMFLEGKQWPMYIYYILFPVVIFYAISVYKKNNNLILSLGDAIKIGLAIGVISAVVADIYDIIFNLVIDPEFTDKILKASEEQILNQPNLTPEMREQSLKVTEIFINPFIRCAVFLGFSAFFGLFWSLIAGLIMKNDGNN